MIFQLKIYHSHGTVDQVIPIEWARKLESVLDKLSNALLQEYPIGHGVSPQIL
jgi:phospholipase/carboxylesterase